MLGLLQCLAFTSSPWAPLAADVYLLSQDETQNFPMQVTGINITAMVLLAFKKGTFNRQVLLSHMERGQVIVLKSKTDLYLYHTPWQKVGILVPPWQKIQIPLYPKSYVPEIPLSDN